MPAPFIYINSWPGVGKHTISKELEKLFDGKARLIHNHLHIDLAGALLPRSGSPGQYQQLRYDLREVLFKTLSTASDTFDYLYIFTDFQSDNELGRSVVQHHVEAAKARGCAFIPIVLICDEITNAQRMRSHERIELVEGGKGMLLDTSVLQDMRGRGDIARFKCPELLELDVTSLLPTEAARTIQEHVKSVMSRERKVKG